MRIAHTLGQEFADKHTLVAQRYAGYLIGHPYRHKQQTVGPTAITVEAKPWREPAITRDDCEFCKRLTDEEVTRKVAGYQHEIDIETLRMYGQAYSQWLMHETDEVPETEGVVIQVVDPDTGLVEERQFDRGLGDKAANRRRFIELHIDTSPDLVTALPMVDLPLRIKRKMCIEWAHLYRDYLKENPDVVYDFEKKEFYRELPDLPPLDCCGGTATYNMWGNVHYSHADTCIDKQPDNHNEMQISIEEYIRRHGMFGGYGFLGGIG
jgi:hypothetical protein